MLLLVSLLTSCNNETSLQEYYVENQADTSFVALDVPASLLLGDNMKLDPEQKATLESIQKVNLLGYPVNEESKASFEAEKEKIREILSDEKYQTLMRISKGTTKAEFYYLGEDDAIDELIVFGADENLGFGVARVLGNDMNPEDIISLVRSFQKDDGMDLEGLQKLLFKK